MFAPDNLDDLVRRAKEGRVSEQELKTVARALRDSPASHTYRLLYVLARAGSSEYEDLIAKYVDYAADPQVAALALRSLCVQWGLAQRYRADILAALDGKAWDSIDEQKQAAISAAGELLRLGKDCAVLRRLIACTEGYGTDLNARFALEALARALGEPHQAAVIPRSVEAAASWVASIRSRVDARLRAECA